MSIEPLPCPDCGKKPKISPPVGHLKFLAGCDNPDCPYLNLVTGKTEEEVVKKWNDFIEKIKAEKG